MAPARCHNCKPVIPLLAAPEEKDCKPEFVKHSCVMQDGNGNSETEFVKHSCVMQDDNGNSETVEERVPEAGGKVAPEQLLQFLASFAEA